MSGRQAPNFRLVYLNRQTAIELKKVWDGCWVSQDKNYTDEETKEEFFKQSELFQKPMLVPYKVL